MSAFLSKINKETEKWDPNQEETTNRNRPEITKIKVKRSKPCPK